MRTLIAVLLATSLSWGCGGSGGSASDDGSSNPQPSPALPTVTLSASPTSVASGGSATLAWNSANATSCTASGGWSGTKATSGNQSTGALNATTSFTLTCTGAGGNTTSQTVTVSVSAPPAPPSVALSASPTTVVSGSASTLTWSSANATSCTASGGWSGTKATSGSQSTGALDATTSFTLACSGAGGTASQTVTVSVGTPPAAPTVTLSASPTAVVSGGSSTLSWSSTNATSCTASGGWSGNKATSGSQSTGALTANTSYTLSCTGAGGSASNTATVTVTAPAPSVTLTANPTSIGSGGSSTLSWSSTNATTCTASGGWSGSKATSGSQSTGELTATTTYTLVCTGAGGSASDSMTVAVGAATATRFPLHTEAGKRYLVDANGQPFFVHGDTPWSLMVQPTRAEADQYLENRRLKGFNTILVNLIEHRFADNPPFNAYGQAPFTVPGDFSTPNEAYFAHAEYVIAKAAEKGILVMLAPSYMGYGGGSEGWYAEMVANGEDKLRAYGRYVATRFKDYDNILWVEGGDYNPPEKALLRAVANGIQGVETTRLHTFHGARGTSALAYLGTSEPWLDVNNIYTDSDEVVPNAFLEYGRSTMPFFLIEAWYEGWYLDGRGARTQAYQAVLSGGTGHLYGNNPLWHFNTPGVPSTGPEGQTWQEAMDNPGAVTMPYLRSLLESFPWWTLEPDRDNALLTNGIGSGAERAAAARTGNGSLALFYLPTLRTITIDCSKLSGPNVRARWYDPTNGSYSELTSSPFPATGSRTFTPSGRNAGNTVDWVLVLQSIP